MYAPSISLRCHVARIESAFLRITEFTADASHELRTPIALIHTEAELALRRSRDASEYREALQQILVESDRTAKLIEELLALARADSGGEALNIQSLDLVTLLKESATKWAQVASLRNLQFEQRLEAQRLPVMGDGNALRRVIDILLDNAFKYTPVPGKVSLSAEQKDGHVLVSVEDTGIGIEPADVGRLFVAFQQLDAGASKQYPGTGLGLALTKRLVEAQGGRVGVRSALTTGTVFVTVTSTSLTRTW